MFLINSRLGQFAAASFNSTGKPLHLTEAILFPKLRIHFAEFLSMVSLKRLGMLYLPTCVGLGYGLLELNLEAFLGSVDSITLRGLASRHQFSA